MNLDRRDVLKIGAAAGAGLVAGCDASPAWNFLARRLESQPETLFLPTDPELDLPAHVLNRLGYG